MAALEIFDGTNWIQIGGGGGTVTSVGILGSPGLEIDGSPITQSGNIEISLSPQLQAFSLFSTSGIIAKTGIDTFAARSITGTNGVSVTNGSGISGNPSISLTNIYPNTFYINNPASLTIDRTGRVTGYISAINPFISSVTLTGDVTGTGTDTLITTLSTFINRSASQAFNFSSSGQRFDLIMPNGGNYELSFGLLRDIGGPVFGWEFYYNTNSGGNNYCTWRFNSQNIIFTNKIGVNNLYNEIDFFNNRLINVATPVNSTDGANKSYIDTLFTAQLQNLSSLATTGLVTRIAANTFETRTLTVGDGLSILYGNGVTGNPSISLSTPLRDIAIFAGQGFLAKKSDGSVNSRVFSVGTGLNINFGDGVSGNPNIYLADTLFGIASITSGTGFYVRTSSTGGTCALRTISVGNGLSIINGNGVNGNPIIDFIGPVAITANETSQTFGSGSFLSVNNVNTTSSSHSGLLFQKNGLDNFKILVPNFTPGYMYFTTYYTNGMVFKTNDDTRLSIEGNSGKVRFYENLKELQIRASSNYLDLRGANVRGSKNSAILETNSLNETASIAMNGDYIQLIQPFTDLGVIFTDEDLTISTSWQSYISSSGSLVTSSSRKIKHSIRKKTHKNYLERLNKLNVYSYALKVPIEDGDSENRKTRKYFKNKRLHVGLISEEVLELFDNCTDNFKTIDFDNSNIKEIQKSVKNYVPTVEEEEYINNKNNERGEVVGIKYDSLLCYTILAMQELTQKVELLESKLN
jgi:hypothetical protein